MPNLPLVHHRLDTHARHRAKALTALLWTGRFRWTASGVIDELLGGNGLVRKLISRKLLVEHPISDPFCPVRFYVTLTKDGLDLLQRHWTEIGCGRHGNIATRLSDAWALPSRPEQRIRTARFLHDLQVQIALVRSFHANDRIERIYLADDLERTPLDKRPHKIPDIIIETRASDSPTDHGTRRIWGEIEFSRKNQREIDQFCSYYRAALTSTDEHKVRLAKFDQLIILCHDSVLDQWRRDFARTVIPRWHFRKVTRDWIRLDAKDWHRFPEISPDEVEAIIQPLS